MRFKKHFFFKENISIKKDSVCLILIFLYIFSVLSSALHSFIACVIICVVLYGQSVKQNQIQ